jgi:hypothetical protein
VNIAQYFFQKVAILVQSAHFIRSNTSGNSAKILPVSVLRVPNTGKPISVLPVLETLLSMRQYQGVTSSSRSSKVNVVVVERQVLQTLRFEGFLKNNPS